jgi:hypothetical protein
VCGGGGGGTFSFRQGGKTSEGPEEIFETRILNQLQAFSGKQMERFLIAALMDCSEPECN